MNNDNGRQKIKKNKGRGGSNRDNANFGQENMHKTFPITECERNEYENLGKNDIPSSNDKGLMHASNGYNSSVGQATVVQPDHAELMNERESVAQFPRPVPTPRHSVQKNSNSSFNKSNDDFKNGAKQIYTLKNELDKSKNKNTVLFCINCEKALSNDTVSHHKDHHIDSIENSMKELEKKEADTLATFLKQVDDQIKSQGQISDMLSLWTSDINDSLQDVFKKLEESSTQNTKDLVKVYEEGNKVLKDTQGNIKTFLDYVNLHTCSKSIMSEGHNIISQIEERPSWIVFNWFKLSLGLIIRSGRNLFCVLQKKSSSRYSSFTLQGDRLLLSSFNSKAPAKEDLCLQYEFICNLFEREDFCAYMKISYNKENKGLVVIRIDKETFWGNQFMSLCTGDIGPSLRNSCFFRSCGKGKPGHHIWGGDYSRNDGSGGEPFYRWRSPLVYNPKPIVKGLLAARYGYNDKSTIFRIYLNAGNEMSPNASAIGREPIDKFAFGYVTDGLDVLEHVSDLPNISATKIEDVGRILLLV